LGSHLLVLQIRKELVDQRRRFSNTASGGAIRRTLGKRTERLEDKIKEMLSELQDVGERELETEQELEEEG
jgi:hypothetical protein